MDQPLSYRVDQAIRHTQVLAKTRLVDARPLLELTNKLRQETLENQKVLSHLVSDVETLSRSTKDPTLRAQIANIRGLYVNLNNKLTKLLVESTKLTATATRRMNDPGRTDDPASSPLQSLVEMMLSIITVLVTRRKEAAKR